MMLEFNRVAELMLKLEIMEEMLESAMDIPTYSRRNTGLIK